MNIKIVPKAALEFDPKNWYESRLLHVHRENRPVPAQESRNRNKCGFRDNI
jgi:hypothetical protein